VARELHKSSVATRSLHPTDRLSPLAEARSTAQHSPPSHARPPATVSARTGLGRGGSCGGAHELARGAICGALEGRTRLPSLCASDFGGLLASRPDARQPDLVAKFHFSPLVPSDCPSVRLPDLPASGLFLGGYRERTWDPHPRTADDLPRSSPQEAQIAVRRREVSQGAPPSEESPRWEPRALTSPGSLGST
jgi:hypothetical protein